jgi:hypothetical protein
MVLDVWGKSSENKENAGNGSKAICRVGDVLRPPSPDFRRSAKIRMLRNRFGDLRCVLYLAAACASPFPTLCGLGLDVTRPTEIHPHCPRLVTWVGISLPIDVIRLRLAPLVLAYSLSVCQSVTFRFDRALHFFNFSSLFVGVHGRFLVIRG